MPYPFREHSTLQQRVKTAAERTKRTPTNQDEADALIADTAWWAANGFSEDDRQQTIAEIALLRRRA